MLTDLLNKLADKMREGEEGIEYNPNNRQGITCKFKIFSRHIHNYTEYNQQ